MKNVVIYFGLMLCLFLTSCGGKGKVIEGSGNKVKEIRYVSDFDAIHVSRGIIVEAVQRNNVSVEVETDDNLQQFVQTEVSDKTLTITIKDGYYISPESDVRVYIEVSDLQSVDISKSAVLRGLGVWNLDDLEIELSSSGNISADTVWFVDDLKIEASTASIFALNVVSKEIEVDYTTAASGLLKGETDELSVEGSLGARLNAKELIYKHLEELQLTKGANLGLKEKVNYDPSEGGLIY